MKKRKYVTDAFAACGLGLEFDLDPEQLEAGLSMLDGMMGHWDSMGISLGYPLGHTSDLDDEAGVSSAYREAITTNLMLRIAPAFGKAIAPQTQIIAKSAYDSLLLEAARPGQMQLPQGMPMGAGNRNRTQRFTPEPDRLIRSNTQELDI